MADHGRYSIWTGDLAMDSWYKAAAERKYDSDDHSTDSGLNETLFFDIGKSNRVKCPSNGRDDWFYQTTSAGDSSANESLSHFDFAKRDGKTGGIGEHGSAFFSSKSNRLAADKPLPPIPSSPMSFGRDSASTPYFDYLFANAGVGSNMVADKFSPDNVSFKVISDKALGIEDISGNTDCSQNDDDAPSPADQLPRTPEPSQEVVVFEQIDDCGFTTHAFLQAGVPITTEDLANNFRAAAGTGLAGHFLVNEADEADKAQATVGFYGGFAVEESPSPYHAPIIDQVSGFGDIRDGAEAFPEQWEEKEKQPRAFTLAEADAIDGDEIMEIVIAPARSVRKPTTRKAAASKNKSRRATSPMILDPTGDYIRDGKQTFENKKRTARDSFVTKSTFDPSSSEDDDVKFLYTKKVRITPNSDKDSEVDSVRAPSTYSLITISGEEELEQNIAEHVSADSVLAETKPELSPIRGYPGQFCGLKTDEQAMRAGELRSTESAERLHLAIGDRLHPNYLFTHTDFHACPNLETLDYTHFTAPPESQNGRCILYAYDLSSYAAEMPRTEAEEELRREVHRECALARLEGVSVGQYRYYQGHLNIEEYNGADMCICWDVCECSKLCTRFGDLICPCSKDIKLHQH